MRHGGAEKVLATFLKNLPEDKYDIDLLLNLYSGKYLSEIPDWINVKYLNKGEMITTNRPQDIPIKIFRVLYQNLFKIFPKLLYKYILKNKKYDVEIAANHALYNDILNSPNSLSKKIVWIHIDLKKSENPIYNDTTIRKFFGFDKIMTISEHIQKDFESLAQNEDEKNRIVRIYNPLDTEEILRKSVVGNEFLVGSSEHPKRKTENRKLTFISVGTVFPQKGFDRLLKVHKKLLDEGFFHRVQIVGDGYDFENIKNLRNALGLQETAEMIGFTDNPYPYFKNADFYILSSRYEGFPTVLFEAITLKKNIIATDVSGVREMLKNGRLGMIVDNSEEGIYQGMKQALTNPKSFEMYQNAISKYEMPFTLEHSVNTITKIIDEL